MDWTVMVQKRWEKKHSAMYNAFNVWYQNDLVAPTWNNPQHPASGFLVSASRDELLERRLLTTSAAEISLGAGRPGTEAVVMIMSASAICWLRAFCT